MGRRIKKITRPLAKHQRLIAAGLGFIDASHSPSRLPARSGLVYFHIDSSQRAAEWDKVERSLSLATRLNENLILSNIQGQRELTIRIGGQTTATPFTPYVACS